MSDSPFAIRGMIEGFYGSFYTHPERLSLLRFLGRQGYNLYVYAPKHDRQHRMRWREPYPEAVMKQFAEAVGVAQKAGVEFCYSLAPGVTMSYASQSDFGAVTAKFAAFSELGVRAFSLLLDDITPLFRHEADMARYGSYAEAHADLCNRAYRWLKACDSACSLSMCPTDYHGTAPFSDYLHELGQKLHPDIDIFYTGPEVCSSAIAASDARAFAEAAGRLPLIWDNYPVNDLAMEREMHLGAIRGRDPALPEAAKGIVVNPMCQAEASKVPLASFADYFRAPRSYHPERSWNRALSEVAGESAPALRLFAETSLKSCLGEPESETLGRVTQEALVALGLGDSVVESPAVRELQAYLDQLDEACYHLKFRMDNLALRHDLLPWLELLEYWLWTARYALQTLTAVEQGVSAETPLKMTKEFFDKARGHHKRVGGNVLAPLAELALEGRADAVPS